MNEKRAAVAARLFRRLTDQRQAAGRYFVAIVVPAPALHCHSVIAPPAHAAPEQTALYMNTRPEAFAASCVASGEAASASISIWPAAGIFGESEFTVPLSEQPD